MKKFKKLIYALLLAAPLFIISCGDDEDTGDSSSINYEAPSISEKDTLVTVPEVMRSKSSTDANLALGIIYVDAANIMAKAYTQGLYFDDSHFTGWNTTINADGSKTFYYAYGPIKWWFTYLNSSAKKMWKYEAETAEYKRYTWYYAEETGNIGKFIWYFDGTSNIGWQCDWNVTDAKSTINMFIYDQTTNKIDEKWTTENNKDKSGFVKVYTGESTPYWTMTWNTLGKGDYKRFKADGTTVELSGTFK